MTLLFPLPYDGSPLHQASWDRAQAFVGQRVKVVTEKGKTIVGIVTTCETSSTGDRQTNGVGFRLLCGSDRFPWCEDVNAGLKSIELEA